MPRRRGLAQACKERIVLLAKKGYRDMLTPLSFCPRSELLSAPDRCLRITQSYCPLAGRFVGGIRMGVVRPEQGELQDPFGYLGKSCKISIVTMPSVHNEHDLVHISQPRVCTSRLT